MPSASSKALIHAVDVRTQLTGTGRLEQLPYAPGSGVKGLRRTSGINVFRGREALCFSAVAALNPLIRRVDGAATEAVISLSGHGVFPLPESCVTSPATTAEPVDNIERPVSLPVTAPLFGSTSSIY